MERYRVEMIIAGALLFLPGAAMVALNYYLIYAGRKMRKLPKEEQKRLPSGAPFYGGMLCALGLIVAFGIKRVWLWVIPLLADPGCVGGLALSLFLEYLPDIKQKFGKRKK